MKKAWLLRCVAAAMLLVSACGCVGKIMFLGREVYAPGDKSLVEERMELPEGGGDVF